LKNGRTKEQRREWKTTGEKGALLAQGGGKSLDGCLLQNKKRSGANTRTKKKREQGAVN